MTRSSSKSLISYQEILEQTRLGRICGKKKLFRDRYRIRQILGRGGFGVTFLGQDMTLPGHPLCVIKQLCLPQGSKPEAIERARKRFRKEAKILSVLGHHSQIPLLLDYYVIEGECYLVQEFVKGFTLSRLFKHYGVQPEEFVKRVLKGILPVLTYIHTRGVIHRDIKPQNIILASDDGRLVLIDFGSVKEEFHLEDQTQAQALTRHFIGTVGFSPPEQFSLRPVYASDLYSLGVTCLFLLTGKKPSDLQDPNDKHQMLWRDHADVSPQFARILDKMMYVDLDERYDSAEAVLNDLNFLLAQSSNINTIITSPSTLIQKETEVDLTAGMVHQSKKGNFQAQQKNRNERSLQERNLQPTTPQTAPAHAQHSSGQSVNKSEYSADLFASYSVYNRLSQTKTRLDSEPPAQPPSSSRQNTQGKLKASEKSTKAHSKSSVKEESDSLVSKMLKGLNQIFS